MEGYKVVTANNIISLMSEVNEHLRNGYVLQGGVSSVSSDSTHIGSSRVEWVSTTSTRTERVYEHFMQAVYKPKSVTKTYMEN